MNPEIQNQPETPECLIETTQKIANFEKHPRANQKQIAQAKELLTLLAQLVDACDSPSVYVVAQVKDAGKKIIKNLQDPKKWPEFHLKAKTAIMRSIDTPLVNASISNRPQPEKIEDPIKPLKPKHIKILTYFSESDSTTLTTDQLLEAFKDDPEFQSFNQKAKLGKTLAVMRDTHGLFKKGTPSGTWELVKK